MFPAVLLCGGRGTRAYPFTRDTPKPLLEVAGDPILLHAMRIYAAHGVRRFVLAGGFQCEKLRAFADRCTVQWQVEVVDTGLETKTARRIAMLADRLDTTFLASYADGVGDVDIAGLLAHHRAFAGAATVTTVAMTSPFGIVEAEAGRVVRFREKPVLSEYRINAGFFVFEPRVFDHWCGDDLENDVLPHLANLGELTAYEHGGFWKSADTYKDLNELRALAEGGAPWQTD